MKVCDYLYFLCKVCGFNNMIHEHHQKETYDLIALLSNQFSYIWRRIWIRIRSPSTRC